MASPRIRPWLALAIRLERERRGWTIGQLAQRADVDASHMGLIEQGEHMPRVDLLERLCDVFEVELSDLFREAEQERDRTPRS